MNMIVLERGQPYPMQCPNYDTAIADFLRSGGNRLLIVATGMDHREVQAFRTGKVTGGFLYADGAMLWLFRFYDNKGNALFTFDAPFDVRVIPTDDRTLHNIDNPEQRLLVDIHAVDERRILRAIRAVTLPPELTLLFLSAVQDQLATNNSGQAAMQRWMQQHPADLIKQTKTWTLGQ